MNNLETINQLRQWVCWEDRNGSKVPIGKDGEPSGANVKYETTYSTRDEAEATGRNVGFVFTSGDPYCGVDLDDCLTEDGSVEDWAKPILKKFERSYMEVSPSRRGIKIFCIGKLPENIRHQVKIENGAVEVYDRGRYFTVTDLRHGEACDVADCQDAIDWLIGRYELQTKQTVSVPYVLPPVGDVSLIGTLQGRMYEYAAKCGTPQEGERNNRLYGIAATLWDFRHGSETPTFEDVYNACATVAARCDFPETELRAVVEKAEKHRQKRQPHDALAYDDESDDEIIRKILQGGLNVMPKEQRESLAERYEQPVKPFPYGTLHIPGFISEFCDWALRTAPHRQPQLSLGVAITLLGALTGRKISSDDGSVRTNIYLFGVSPPGSGKDWSRKCAVKLCEAAGCSKYIGPERLASNSAVSSALENQSSILLMLDEFGKLFRDMDRKNAPYLSNIATNFCELYTSADVTKTMEGYADATKTKTLVQPNLCLYATSSDGSLFPYISIDNVSDGFIPRCGLLEGDYEIAQRCKATKPPESLVETVKAWNDLTPKPTTDNLQGVPDPWPVPIDDDADARLFSHRLVTSERLPKDGSEFLANMWARVADRSYRLALIFAASRFGPDKDRLRITIEDANHGIALSNWMCRRWISRLIRQHILAENDVDRTLLRVLEAIRRVGGGPMTMTEITRVTRGLRSSQRQEAVMTLVAIGDLRLAGARNVEIGSGATRSVALYEAT